MMNALTGLPVDVAVKRLHENGIHNIEIYEINAPRGNTPRGTLRVVRVQNSGQKITCARFPDAPKEEKYETEQA